MTKGKNEYCNVEQNFHLGWGRSWLRADIKWPKLQAGICPKLTGGKWPKIFGRNWPKETAKVGKCPKFCVRKWPKKNDMLENIRNLTGQPIGRLVWHFYCSGSRHMGLSPTPAHTHRGPPIIPPLHVDVLNVLTFIIRTFSYSLIFLGKIPS